MSAGGRISKDKTAHEVFMSKQLKRVLLASLALSQCASTETPMPEMTAFECTPQTPERNGGVEAPHQDADGFFVPWCNVVPPFGKLWRWMRERDEPKWPTHVANASFPPPPKTVNGSDVRITFIGHATLLIQTGGLNILTDPLYSDKVGPWGKLGPERVRAPGVAFADLPPIHAVLVSHNHYDHMDLPTLTLLAKHHRPQMIMPLGNGAIVKESGTDRITELDWWQSVALSPEIVVTAIPAQHWSRRGVFDTNKALWSGFVLQTPAGRILYAGDTGYGPHFSAIRQRLGAMDVSLLPIGAYLPRWFMAPQHMGPEQAVLAHRDLESRWSIALHHDTVPLASDDFGQALAELPAARQRLGVAGTAFFDLKFGEGRSFTPRTAP